jgi:salicylate hydroxylase
MPFEDAYAVLGDNYVKAQFALRCGTNGLVFGFPMSQNTTFFIGVIAFNNSHDRTKGDKWNILVDKTELTQCSKDWDQFAQKLVSSVPDDGSTLGWSVWEMQLAPTYVKDRVAMIGDAAHATTPFAGAGAAMAIEDPCVVSTLLGKYLDPTRFARNNLGKVQSARLALQSYDAAGRL